MVRLLRYYDTKGEDIGQMVRLLWYNGEVNMVQWYNGEDTGQMVRLLWYNGEVSMVQ